MAFLPRKACKFNHSSAFYNLCLKHGKTVPSVIRMVLCRNFILLVIVVVVVVVVFYHHRRHHHYCCCCCYRCCSTRVIIVVLNVCVSVEHYPGLVNVLSDDFQAM